MKKLILGFLAISILLSGCGGNKLENKEKVTLNSGTVSEGIVVGSKLEDFKFKDQFDKETSLKDSTKKVMFAFTKPTGHLIKMYMADKKENYLTSRDIIFIADISGMPSIIATMFAIPDMKESKYPILLIKEKEKAMRFRNEQHKNSAMIITLKNKIIQNVKFVTNDKDLKSEID